MFENPRRGRQARNFTTNVPKILDLKSSFEQIFFRKLSLGAPAFWGAFIDIHYLRQTRNVRLRAKMATKIFKKIKNKPKRSNCFM